MHVRMFVIIELNSVAAAAFGFSVRRDGSRLGETIKDAFTGASRVQRTHLGSSTGDGGTGEVSIRGH
jgi:hypothetical protein